MNSVTHLLRVEYKRFRNDFILDPGDDGWQGAGKQTSFFLFSLWLKGEKKHRRVLDRKRSDTNLLPEHQRLIASVNVLPHILT